MDEEQTTSGGAPKYFGHIFAASLVAGLGLTYALFFRDLKKPYEEMPTKVLEGKVVEEKYSPAGLANRSRYRFSIETTEGRVSVNVLPGLQSIETIDTLIHPGDQMKATVHDFGNKRYVADADEIFGKR